MQRVLLITGHYLESRRRAGFHWLADAYHRLGWDVTFVTAALSWLSRLRQDYRFQYPVHTEANQIKRVNDRLHSFVWFTWWHPANLRNRFLNSIAAPWFRRYGQLPLGKLESRIHEADLIIFESTPALLLFDRFKQLNANARYVYRVSDDLRVLKNHPVVLETERRIMPRFDRVSFASRRVTDQFTGVDRATVDSHGLHKPSFEKTTRNPYNGTWTANAVFVGNTRLDTAFVDIASHARPDWGFHILGAVDAPSQRPNVFQYGELPFTETVPYIQHADIGLFTLNYAPGAEAFAESSNKVQQYTFCRLPIVAPQFLACAGPHVVGYEPGDEDSIRTALHTAGQMDRSSIDPTGIRSWTELAQSLAGEQAP